MIIRKLTVAGQRGEEDSFVPFSFGCACGGSQ